MLTRARGSMVVAVGYKLEGLGKAIGFFSLYKTFQLQLGSGVDSLWQIWVPRIFLGLRGRPACKADNLTGVWADCLENAYSFLLHVIFKSAQIKGSFFYSEGLLAARPIPELEAHFLSAVGICPHPGDTPCHGNKGPTVHGVQAV
jgi:hypothetical protein